MIRFSIVVVCLNPGERLRETIESIRQQTYGNYEIVIKDGLSEDGSLEALPEDKAIRLYREKDKGIYDAMNQALEKVRGEYIYFLNCGDLFYDKNVLQRVSDAIDRQAGVGRTVFYGDIFERLTKERVASNPHMDAFGCYRNVPCHQACFYARELMELKKFDTDYRVRADYEHFLWCFFIEGARMVYLPFLIAGYEGGGFSETKENRRKSAEEHREITGKYMTKGQIIRYRVILLVTLAPLRTWLAENKTTARIYNRLKRKMYGA